MTSEEGTRQWRAASPSSNVTSADSTGIAFTATGTGPALVIVDGAMSYRQSNPIEQAVAQALAGRYTVYTFDRCGRGESGDADTYTVQAEVNDIAALIEHVGGVAALLGFSSGAVLALEAALAGLPVPGLALYEPPFVVSADRPPVGPDYLAYDAAVMGQTQSGDPAARQRYAPVTTPTLVMHDGTSDAWMAAGATAIADVLPNASHKALPDQDHDVCAEALVPVLSDWLPTLQS